MQLTFTQDPKIGTPGQIQDAESSQIVSLVAAVDLLPGRVVEVDSNNRINYPSSTTLGRVAGITCYVAGALPGSWKAGDQVPVLRKGRIFAEFSGGTQGNLVAANVNHSSTIATNRGKVSTSATSATAGSEVSALGPCVLVRPVADTSMCIVELNLP